MPFGKVTRDTARYIHIGIADGYSRILGTFTISAKLGIKAIYGLWPDKKKKIVALLFDKAKWTIGSAKKWIKDHKDRLRECLDLYLIGRSTTPPFRAGLVP